MIQSVKRAFAILRCFEGYEELGVTEISKMVGLNKSTAFGLISTLRDEKMLQADEATGKLRLGLDLLRLAENVKRDLCNICSSYINYLLQTIKETVNLAVRDGDCAIFIEKKESPHSMRISTTISQPSPLYCTAAGKAILSGLPDDEIEDYLRKVQFKPFTENTIKTIAELRNQIVKIRKEGCAFDYEELEYGMVCVAVPLIDHNKKIAGSLSVSGPVTRMTKAARKEIKALLLQAMREINSKI
jgi:DNA-binding IclR family transcriptional regulator